MRRVYELRVARIVGLYVAAALAWIVSSDYVADVFIRRPGIHTYKGAAFVLATGALLWVVVRRAEASISRHEAELVASQEQFRRLVENAPAGIYIQTDGYFRYVNPAASRLFGVAREELVGRGVLDFIHPDYHTAAMQRMERLRAGALAPLMEETFLRADGTPVEVEISAVPYEYAGATGSLAFVYDITDRKHSERQRRELEEQVRQAQKLESIGRLAGGVAHDFNNLLTVINGYSDMLLAELPEHDPSRGGIHEIRAAGERATSLTAQLLAFSRKDRQRARAVDLNGLVRDLERMLRRLVGEHIEIATRLDESAGPVLADPSALNQVLMNLVVNARDAMPGGGRIEIRTEEVEVVAGESPGGDGTPGRYVVLNVTDTGSGIPLEIQARIFEPFFTTKQVGQGTGLGLSTVYGIVRNCDGWIRVDSTPGRGTTMRVFLPRHQGAANEPKAGGKVSATGGDETILLVEDDDAVRLAAETMLRQLGYRVHSAAGAEEALEIAGREGGRRPPVADRRDDAAHDGAATGGAAAAGAAGVAGAADVGVSAGGGAGARHGRGVAGDREAVQPGDAGGGGAAGVGRRRIARRRVRIAD